MKRALILPALAVGFLLWACDGNTPPMEPEVTPPAFAAGGGNHLMITAHDAAVAADRDGDGYVCGIPIGDAYGGHETPAWLYTETFRAPESAPHIWIMCRERDWEFGPEIMSVCESFNPDYDIGNYPYSTYADCLTYYGH